MTAPRAPRCPSGRHAAPRGLAPLLSPALAPVLALALALLLPACAAGPDHAASQVLGEVLESHRASLAGLGAAAQPGATPVVSRSPASVSPGRVAPGSVAALIGQPPDRVLATLGQPTRRRPEGDAEIWLYQGASCALDVVLYRERNTTRVAWAAARASGTERRTEAACLRELVSG